MRRLTDGSFPVAVSHGFSPQSRPFRRLDAVFSPFLLTREMNVTTDHAQFFHLIVTHFPQDTSSTHSDITMAFFRHMNQEKINCVGELSQQHILARFENRCFPPCFATYVNENLNGLVGETIY